MLAWHIQKLLDKPKRFIQRCCPNRRGKKTTTKTSNQPCDQPDDTIPSMVQTASTSTHPKNGVNSHKPTKQKIIGTLSSSHTTHAHPNTPHTTGPIQSSLQNLTHTHTTNKTESHADPSERNHQRSFSYRHLTKPATIRLPSGALSVTLTHIKLHTPTQQHKSPG